MKALGDIETLRPFVAAFVDATGEERAARLVALVAEAFHVGADHERAACAALVNGHFDRSDWGDSDDRQLRAIETAIAKRSTRTP